MKKRIGSIIVLSIVALLAIAVFVLYLVPVNYTPKLDNPDRIVVYQTSTKWNGFGEGSTEYKNVVEKYNQSFTQNLLSAIFAGQTGSAFNQTTNGELPSETTKPSLSNCVQFEFDEAQTLVVNGHEQNAKITSMFLLVVDTETYSEVSVYYQKSTSGYYLMKTLANESNLYDYITGLSLPEQPAK